MSDYAQITNNRPAAAGQTANRSGAKAGAGFDDVLKSQADKNLQEEKEDAAKKATDEDYRSQIREHMEEMIDRIRHGTIQPKIAIGGVEEAAGEIR